MLEIKCPYCGNRSQNEFSYGGDANLKRPKPKEVKSMLQIAIEKEKGEKNRSQSAHGTDDQSEE